MRDSTKSLKIYAIKDTSLECISTSDQKKVEFPKLNKQLDYIYEKSAFYRSKFKKEIKYAPSLFENFERLPFTTKNEILRDQIDFPPFGSNLCVNPQKILRIHKTSGTTNRPVMIALTSSDILAAVASGSRCFWASGLRPSHRVVHCLSYCLWMGGYTDHHSLEATGATVIPYGVGKSKELLNLIKDLRIDVIHCTPSYLNILEPLLKTELGIIPTELGLKLGLFAGEPGIEDPSFRKHVESLWGIKAMNANYGMADVLSMFGAECHEQKGLHFMGQGNLLIELIDPQSEEILPIEKGVTGELVATNINREAQPVVRFKTGDLVQILSHNTCTCGRKSFRFNVLGRSDDMIVVKGVNIFPSLIKTRLTRFLDRTTGQFQIIINSRPPYNELNLRLEYLGKLNDEEKMRLMKALKDDFKASISIKPKIELIPEGTLSRTQGKTKTVLRKISKTH